MENSPTPLPINRTFPLPAYIAASLTLMLLAALIELHMGRLLLSKSGHITFWAGKNNPAENSQQIADWYSFSHNILMFIHPFQGIKHWQAAG